MYPKKISREDLEKMVIRNFEGRIVLVENFKNFNERINNLLNKKVLGFDTETRPSFKKGNVNSVSLLQLSDGDTTYLFRLNKIGLPGSIIKLLKNPQIIKVGVAIHDDLIALRRLKNFNPAGFIELQTMVKNIGIESVGLKYICGIVLGFRISKAQQLSNWEQDILDRKQLRYAATDAWIPLEIYNKLTTQLN